VKKEQSMMTTTIYAAHRETQTEGILEAAEELFIENGIRQVTIGAIAKKARLTRATIYKYFSSKEQIAEEIYKTVTKSWSERNAIEVWQVPGNGYESIERFVKSHFNNLLQNPREARFVAEFNSMYAKAWPVEETMKLIDETLGGERKQVLNTIRLGQTDGSLRSDIEAELMLAAFFNFLAGMNNRLGEMGMKVETEYKMSTQAIFTQVCCIFLDGMKPSPTSQ
jgi:AcrR family transcriptional regulator